MNKLKKIDLEELIRDAVMTHDWCIVESSDTSNITDMSRLFYGIEAGTGIENLDLSSWDTSKVISMSEMFSYSGFNSPLSLDTSSAIKMNGMFSYSSFNSALSFDTSRVTDTSNMFYKSDFNQKIDFNMDNILIVYNMFSVEEYTNPFPNILNIPSETVSKIRLIQMHRRNEELELLMSTGACENENELLAYFEQHNPVLFSKVKSDYFKKHLEVKEEASLKLNNLPLRI